MAPQRKKRRKVTPDVYRFIAEQAAAGASARMILKDLGTEADISERTVQDVMAELAPNPGDWWTLTADSDPADNAVILDTLREVIRETHGKTRGFTVSQAKWIAQLRRCANFDPWHAYVSARMYDAAGGMSHELTAELAVWKDYEGRRWLDPEEKERSSKWIASFKLRNEDDQA